MPAQILNGKVIDARQHPIVPEYKGVFFGQALNLKFRLHAGELLFAEASYFHLMASMRKVRMEIPLEWTPEFFYNLIRQLAEANEVREALINFHVFGRQNKPPGHLIYLGEVNENQTHWNLDVYKEVKVAPSVFSALPCPRAELQVAEIFANENSLDDLLLLNTDKKIAHSLHGNLFALIDDQWITNRLEDGAWESVWRTQLLQWSKKKLDWRIEEKDFIAFALQKATECFVLVEAEGFFPVANFRKKEFEWKRGKLLARHFYEDNFIPIPSQPI